MLILLTLMALLSKTKTMKNTSKLDFSIIKDGIRNFARNAGRVATRPLLQLYYVMKSDKTPRKDKVMILSTLAYVVLPVDLLSAKRLPIIGWLDEVASVSVAIQKVSQHITPEVERKVEDTLDRWFAEYTDYIEVE